MIARPTRWIVSAILLFLVAGVTAAPAIITVTVLSGPTATAQVGVSYSSGFTAQNGLPPYAFAITSGALPPGLNLSQPSGNSTFAPLTGVPLPAASGNTYNFQIRVTDNVPADAAAPAGGADSQEVARRRGLAQSGNHTDTAFASFSITVSPASAVGTVGVPSSPWTLALVMAGLAGAGFWRLRRTRRA